MARGGGKCGKNCFPYCLFCDHKLSLLVAGADLGFFRGWRADLQKSCENFDNHFFRATKLILRALLKH